MKNQPERLADRADHIVAAGGQDITERGEAMNQLMCKCEGERADRLVDAAKMPREMAEAMARMWWGEEYDAQRCDHCPKVPKP